MKKSLLAVLLITALLISILPGCKNTESTETTNSAVVDANDIAGSVLINAGAVVEIMYNSAGTVLQIEGIGKDGLTVAPSLQNCSGMSCANAAYEVIIKCADNKYLPTNAQTVLVKFVKDSVIPHDNFITDVASKAQEALPNIPITQVRSEDLDSRGYIGADKIKDLLELYLASPVVPTFEGSLKPANGVYFLCANIDNTLSYYTVNAVTGEIADCSQADYEMDFYSIHIDEEEELPQEETYDYIVPEQ